MRIEARSCAEIRELLLEADPAELRAADESLLAVHLRGCARCAADAERLLEAQRRMADALADLTASGVAPPLLPRIRQRGWRARSAPASRGRTRRRLIMGAAPLAAAAVLVLLLLQRPGRDEPLPLEPRREQIAVAGDVPVVNVTTAHDVAIMKTADPNITVVWYLKRER